MVHGSAGKLRREFRRQGDTPVRPRRAARGWSGGLKLVVVEGGYESSETAVISRSDPGAGFWSDRVKIVASNTELMMCRRGSLTSRGQFPHWAALVTGREVPSAKLEKERRDSGR